MELELTGDWAEYIKQGIKFRYKRIPRKLKKKLKRSKSIIVRAICKGEQWQTE